jgi:hypothetical protein
MRIKNKTKIKQHTRWFVMYPFERVMVFDATFNNTSVSINKDLKHISADDSLVVFMLSVNCKSLSMTYDRSGYSGFLHQ